MAESKCEVLLALSKNRYDVFLSFGVYANFKYFLRVFNNSKYSTHGIVYLGDYYMVNPLERENFDIKENKIIKLPGFAILSFCLI